MDKFHLESGFSLIIIIILSPHVFYNNINFINIIESIIENVLNLA